MLEDSSIFVESILILCLSLHSDESASIYFSHRWAICFPQVKQVILLLLVCNAYPSEEGMVLL